jgi:beta-galactosidase
MRNKTVIAFIAFIIFSVSSFGKNAGYFNDKNLTLVGAYYYPEHWNPDQWERDLKNMSSFGFEFTHFGEFAWAQLEPKEGVYDFGWLDKAVELAGKYNLKVVLCTSTATPPVWLTRKYPEILITNENGTTLDHGARQHASFANPLYRELSLKMIEQLAKRYGNDKRVIGWQLDNEPAVQFDYGVAAQKGFRQFLRNRYKSIDDLNAAWGTSFWSQTYSDFDEINIPKTSMMFMNPHQILDYKRFAASMTADFLDLQAKCIKEIASDKQFVTTNYIPSYEEGHVGLCKNLDFHSYTRYMVFGDDTGVGKLGYRVGDPLRIDYANDFFRPIDNVYGVMELQPGQVNWGEINSQPLPGAVRLWLWNVFAGGSDFTCTYRYRQPLYGMEQYHSGIVGTDGVTLSSGGKEYCTFIKEINALRKNFKPKETKPASYKSRYTAILYNHENAWSIDRQKQNKSWNTERHIMNYYRALKSFGAPVDVIREDDDFSKYPFMIVPAFQMIDDVIVKKWRDYASAGGNIIFTCRTGHKDRYGRLFECKFQGKMSELIGADMDFYDLLQPSKPGKVSFSDNDYEWFTWGEVFKPFTGTDVWGTYKGDFYDGKPAILHRSLGKGTVTYVGLDSKDGLLEKAVLNKLYSKKNVELMNLPEGVLVEYRNGFGIAMNYSDKTFTFPLKPDKKILVGTTEMKTTDVLVWEE